MWRRVGEWEARTFLTHETVLGAAHARAPAWTERKWGKERGKERERESGVEWGVKWRFRPV